MFDVKGLKNGSVRIEQDEQHGLDTAAQVGHAMKSPLTPVGAIGIIKLIGEDVVNETGPQAAAATLYAAHSLMQANGMTLVEIAKIYEQMLNVGDRVLSSIRS